MRLLDGLVGRNFGDAFDLRRELVKATHSVYLTSVGLQSKSVSTQKGQGVDRAVF